MSRTFEYDVFLSHNQADKSRVRKLAEQLRAAGLRVWLDEWVVQPGDDIYLTIERGLEAARTLVLCLSPSALGSDWVTLERSTALFRDPSNVGRRFIPLLFAECKIPDTLRRLKYVDYREETQTAFDQVLAGCRPDEMREILPSGAKREEEFISPRASKIETNSQNSGLNIDIGIITTKPEEFSAIDKLSNWDPQPANPLARTQILEDDRPISLPDKSPFHPFGVIPFDHPSYIKRDSDRQMENLLINNSFICLHGDFTSGKSSLLIRVPCMLSKEWKVFRPSIEFYKSGRKGTLEKCFFDELKDGNETLKNWISLSKFLEESKLVLLIDEISKCSTQDAAFFIERLYALVEQSPSDHVRVMLTIKESLDVYIKSIGLENPKYHNRWKIVELTQFNDSELIELLNLFPMPIILSLRENLSLIKERTSMEPSVVQKLCDDLWKHLRVNTSPTMDINQQVQSYLKEYRKG